VGVRIGAHARRVRGALRPMTRDARLSALSPWRFWAPGARFSHRSLPQAFASAGSVRLQQAPCVRVVVPGVGFPYLPRRRFQSRCRGTPLLAPYSGMAREHAPNELGCAYVAKVQIEVKN